MKLNSIFSASIFGALSLGASFAADLSLTRPLLSANGNIAVTARGDAGATAIVEVSPNMSDWALGDSVTLAEGEGSFFIRPSATSLFIRLRPAEASEIPNPFHATFTPNSDFIRSNLAYDQAMSLHVVDDNEFDYKFALGDDSMLSIDELKMGVVNEASGLPAGLTYLGGATVEPFGMVIFGEATLSITAPDGVDLTHAGVIAWDADGAEVHFVPFTREGNRVDVPIHRLGGFGLVVSNGGDVRPLLDSIPSEALAREDHRRAIADLNLKAAASKGLAAAPTDLYTCDYVEFWRGFFVRRSVELRAAIVDDSLLENALYMYNGMASVASRMTEPCFASALAAIDLCDSLALEATIASVDKEAAKCRRERDLRALVRLERSAILSGRGSWGRKRSLAQHQHVLDALHECLEFKVKILSSTAVSSQAGTVRTSVSSDIDVHWIPVMMNGKSLYRIGGDADITLDETAWDTLPSPCSAVAAPANGHIYVKQLFLENRQIDVDNVIIHTDEELPLPRYSLLFDPMVPPPSENYTLSCPPAPAVPIMASHWAVAYGSLHKSEIVHDFGKTLYSMKNFFHSSNTAPEKKEFYQQGFADKLELSESTVVTIEYLGGSH
jgi:hypothetical protein